MTVDKLMQQIEETERLITVYRNADEVIVGTQDQIYRRRGLINRTTSRRPRSAVRSSVPRACPTQLQALLVWFPAMRLRGEQATGC